MNNTKVYVTLQTKKSTNLSKTRTHFPHLLADDVSLFHIHDK